MQGPELAFALPRVMGGSVARGRLSLELHVRRNGRCEERDVESLKVWLLRAYFYARDLVRRARWGCLCGEQRGVAQQLM